MSEPDVHEDPRLTPSEKETTIRFAKDQDSFHIFTEMRAIMTPLLDNPAFEEESRRTRDGDLVALEGTLPLACLSVKGKPRNDGSVASAVVSTYSGETNE